MIQFVRATVFDVLGQTGNQWHVLRGSTIQTEPFWRRADSLKQTPLRRARRHRSPLAPDNLG